MNPAIVATISLLYIGLLFAIAYYADKKREAGKSLISNPHIYALSIAVYCTSWTFYGSVGRVATSGIDFLPVYLGPTLIAFSWWFLLRKMVRISKEHNIVSIADFISSRYGKSALLGGVVTVIVVVGIIPYITLQLKAVAETFDLISGRTGQETPTAFIVALFLALFGVLFGARRLDATEHHEGLVAAIALQSLVKIIAFVAAGIFVTYGMFDGFGDIFARFIAKFPDKQHLLLLNTSQIPYAQWFSLTFISMMAIMFLPRQFHIMVIENSNEEHIKSAMWRFPVYMFLINLFVIPIALGGIMHPAADKPDYFVIQLPLVEGHPLLAMLVFIGGLSASAGMVMIESVALSTMILNHLVMPVILKLKIKADISGILINIKRFAIFAVIFLGFFYCQILGESACLVDIGFISFVAATQFAPALIGGLYWKGATQRGAIVGLVLGFIVWFYTLLFPSFFPESDILEKGLLGLGFLRPEALFALSGFDRWTHSLFWSLFFNVGAYLFLSILTETNKRESEQAVKFVDAFGPALEPARLKRLSKAPTIVEFVDLMAKFIGPKRAGEAIAEYVGDREIDERGSLSDREIPELKHFTELTLAASVGAAPARIIIENYLATRGSEMQDVFDIFGSVTLSRTASREQLGVLYEAARLVASGADLQTCLDSILEMLTQQFKFDLCVIRFLDKKKNALVVCSQKGMSSEHLGKSDRELNMNTYIGQTFLTNSPIIKNDTDFLDKPNSIQIISQEKIKSFAHAPITIEGEPVGILSAFSRSVKGIFTDEFVELFKGLAGLIGVALRNEHQTRELIVKREQERELEIAKTIQLGLLPTHTPNIKGISLAGTCVPARLVGGDYYDLLPHGNEALDLVIADVSGHNVGAALIMAETRTFIRSQSQAHSTIGASEMVNALNEFFYEDLTRSELFITMFYLKYNASTQILSFANAGHNLPILWRLNSKTCEQLDAEGLILGIKRNVSFEEKQKQMHPGDILLLYTDGITEAENPEGDFFGEHRLFELLKKNHTLPPQQIVDNLINQVQLFTEAHHFNDDITLVVMRLE